MCSLTAEKVFYMEDKLMKSPGLYTMWTILYLINLICLSTDSTTGPVRDFNIVCSLLSTLYTAMSSYNVVYGNGLPSSMLLMAGPIHQYGSWLLLAYYRGAVYGTSELGVLNGVYTLVVGVFTLDMVVKTWTLALKPQYYLDYVKKEKENTQQ
jgi:hypothetical protein